MIDRYQPHTPQNKPNPFTQSTSDKPSVYDFPDIKKAKFFKLKDFKQMNEKFNEELKRVEKQRNLSMHEEQGMDDKSEEPVLNVLKDSSMRIESFDMSRLQEKRKKTGFMFDCFNVFKKQQKHKQVVQYESQMIDESRYIPNNPFLANNSSINTSSRYQHKNNASFFNIYDSQTHNQSNQLKSSRLTQKQNNSNNLNKKVNNKNQLILTQKQLHQTNQIKLDFKLKMHKPQFCMGAFSHTQSNIFGSGVNLNISLPTLEQHKPFQAMIKPLKKSFFALSGTGNDSMSYGKGMDVDESIFNRIKQSQSRFFEGLEDKQEENEDKKKQQNNNQHTQKEAKKQSQNEAYELAIIGTQQQRKKTERQKNVSRALQFGLIQMDAEQISFIAHKEQQPQNQSQAQNILTRSIFQNYESLLKQPQYLHLPVWQSRITPYNPQTFANSHPTNPQTSLFPINSFEISYQWHQQRLSLLQSQFSVKDDALFMIDDKRLFLLVAQMLQGIQNQLFMLDYEKLEWYIDMRGLRFQHTLRNSFVGFMEDVMKLANMRSRLDKAVEYMSLRPFRKVYFQVAKQVKNVFNVFQEYLLEFVNQDGQIKCELKIQQIKHKIYFQQTKHIMEQDHSKYQQQKHGFLEFFVNIQQLAPEIKLLYQLLICQQQIQRQKWSYFTFDHRFLHSQFYIFQKILKLSRQTDQTTPSTSLLTKRLLRAAFKPIISSLNRILFEQMTSVSSKQEIYLKYYYESTRELFNQISKKMQIVHMESPELYVICKEKLQMGIQISVDGLRSYQKEWAQLFLYKYTQLQAVLEKMIRKQHEERHVKQKQKEVELQLLKKKLKDKTQKQISIKMVEKSKKDQELIKLRKQIKEKEQRKKLQDLIEKQAERGYLLEDELKNKITLLKQKQKLMNELKVNGIDKSNQIKDKQANKRIQKQQKVFSMEESMTQRNNNKQRKNNEMDEQINEKKQGQRISKKQYKYVKQQQLPLISQQNILLPIVNEQNEQRKTNKNNKINKNGQIQQEIQTGQQPRSPKSTRSRKIRKQAGKIRFRGKKQVIPGKIYFNKKLIIPNSEQNQTVKNLQSTDFAQLCQKSKKLNFHPFEQPNSCLIRVQKLNQSFSSQQSLNSQNQQEMQEQLYETYAKDYLPCSKQKYIPTNCIFEICIDKVLSYQAAVVNNCFEILVFQKYHFRDIVKFMKNIFFSQNCDNHRNLLSLSANPSTSNISLKYFNDCFLFDNLPQFLQHLKPSFYNTRQQSLQEIQQRLINLTTGCSQYYGECNIIRQDLEQFVGFQFANLPVILEPYFSYIHLSKYMQIFAFILRIKHCEMMVGESWLLLNEFKKELFRKQKQHKELYRGYFEDKFQFQTKLLNELFVTRHIIQSFLTTYQNYIFFRVIEKEFKSLNKRIQKSQLTELQTGHLKLLDTIIRFAFIDNSVNNITKQIRKLLEYIREFRNIVNLICQDDILQDQKAEVRTKVKFINTSFKQNQKFFQALYFKT